jgi:hypothetical protein
MTCADEDSVICCTQSGLQTASPVHYRQTLIRVGGFDESLPCSQERDLHLRLACHGLHFVRLPEILVRVRRRSGSVSADAVCVLQQHLRIVHRAEKLLKGSGRSTDERLAALAGLLARDARIFLHAGLRNEAQKYFAEARSLHPGGGWNQAYPINQRWLARLLGSELFERLVTFKRRYWPDHSVRTHQLVNRS